MKKIKLTQRQADIVESKSLDELGEWFYKDNRTDTEMYKLFKDFSMERLAKIKLNGYEVESEFKIDDWVVSTLLDGYVGQVEEIIEIEGVTGDPKRIKVDSVLHYPDSLRYATPAEIAEEKERRWWAKHGREVWELKKGDFLVNQDNIALEVTKVPEGEDYCFIDYTKFHYDRIKDRFLVLCFVENRLDVSG